LFNDLANKLVAVQCDQENGSSDGGAVLLKAAERSYGLVRGWAGCLQDRRQPGKVDHSLEELLAQRIYGIACGYPDGNDSARLSSDPVHKLLLNRDPLQGLDLASQPTLSRFENSPGAKELYRMAEVLAESVIRRHAQRLGGKVSRITLDLDPTDDPTHGAQQLALFNGYYHTYCYLPVLGFLTFNDEADSYLFTAVLRPGNASASAGAIGILRRTLELIRRYFPQVRVRVRLDGGFAHPRLLDFLDRQPRLEYAVAMAKNKRLQRLAQPLMVQARRQSRQTQQTEHVYGSGWYMANKWPDVRRVVIKAEVVRQEGKKPKNNPRFVITNLRQTPQWIYEQVYCQRGEIENRIKELHEGLQMDRTSCSRFWANQLRILLTAAAYVLMQELRLRAAGTDGARAQVWILRERLLKLGAQVRTSVRRIVLHLPVAFPFLATFNRIALSLGAASG
jgi:hypothetical protein